MENDDGPESSDQELHDIEWPEYDPFFDYTDVYTLPAQIAAVIENNVGRLDALLKSGKSININDNIGNTPLHVAVIKDRREAFDYMLRLDDLRLDVANFEGFTPLMLAVHGSREYCISELVKKGASVNLANSCGNTALHLTVEKDVKLAQLLIDSGADLDAQNCLGETPLFTACDHNDCDLICLLLCHGADAKVTNESNILPFTIALIRQPMDIQEILFGYTFDLKQVPIGLHTLKVAMTYNVNLFYELVKLTSEVVYDECDLELLNDALPFIKPEVFRIFLQKFEDVARHMFAVCNTLRDYVSFLEASPEKHMHFVEFVYILCDTSLARECLQSYSSNGFLLRTLIGRNLPKEVLTSVVCCLLSYGVSISVHDAHAVYARYGFCELFKIMLHMELNNNCLYDQLSGINSYEISWLICDISLGISSFPEKIEKLHFSFNIFKYFAAPKLREFVLKCCTENGTRNLLNHLAHIPSLVELSREAARKHIINKYNVKNNVHFFTALRWLPVQQVYKDIISYATAVYVTSNCDEQ